MTDFSVTDTLLPAAPLPSPLLPQQPVDSSIASRLPRINISAGFDPLGGSRERRDPILTNAPRAQSALQNKYSGYMREIQDQYDERVWNAMLDYDRDRVSRGQPPLSEADTLRALQSAQEGLPATPEAERSLFNVPGNALKNLGDIVKSIPRMPAAALNEVRDLSTIGSHLAEADNPIEGLASAPGIRLLPGSYVVENIAGGTPGELLRNPLFTALDVLPFANQAAKGTKLVKAASEAADSAAKGLTELAPRDLARMQQIQRRPISGIMNNTLDLDGNIVRNARGEFVDQITQSRMMRPLNKWFSQGERDVQYAVNSAGQRVHNIFSGIQDPGTTKAAKMVGAEAKEADVLARRAFVLREKLIEADPTFAERIPDITNRMTTGNFDGLSDFDMAAMEQYRSLVNDTRDWSLKYNYNVLYDGEVYDLKTGNDLRGREAKIRENEGLAAFRREADQGTADPVATLSRARDTLTRPRKELRLASGDPASRTAARQSDINANAVSERTVKQTEQAALRALESSGYDTSHFYGRRKTAKGKEVTYLKKGDEFAQAMDDIIEGRVQLSKKDLYTADEIAQVIAEQASKFPGTSLKVLERGMAKGEWKVVSEALQSIRKQGGNEVLSDPKFVESVRALRERAKFLDKTKRFSDEAIEKQKGQLTAAQQKAIPARFIPEAIRQSDQANIEWLVNEQNFLDPKDAISAEKVTELALRGQWQEIPGFDEAIWRKTRKETAATWMDMRERGFDPLFVHSVPVNKLNTVLYPAQGIIPRDPSSLKERLFDMAPAADDFTIAATHQMMEFLGKREIETALKYIIDMKGESAASLRARYIKAAEARHAKAPVKTVEGHLQELMTENYRRFDPAEQGYTWGSPYLKKLEADQPWIPKATYDNLKDLADPKSIAGGIFDPLTKTFRIAVVGLSLRTQIYNIIGGAISAELHSPGALLRQSDKIRQYMTDYKAGNRSTWFDDELQTMVGSGKQNMMQLDDIEKGRVTEGVMNYMKGEKLRQFWDAAQSKKTPGRPINKFKGTIQGLTEKLYDFNGMFDDMYRMVTYYDDLEKGLKKGYTREAAEAAAIGQTRRVLQDWMGMTPMERGVMKSLVPFYGFMGHALRFVLRYPLDHPLRAEVMTKLAMAEMEDLEGLPTRFLSSMFFGKQDENGNQSAFNLAPMNPFGEVANMMTISGFLGMTNPALTTAFQMVGLEQGTAELYPSLRYDPETGRLSAKHANPLLSLAENTIPQTSLVTAMLGMNSQFNDALARDPAAANRMLLSGMTVPILWRQYNVPQEQFKAEVARDEAATKVKNEALKTGDWSEAMRYPSLVEYLRTLDEMPEEQLSPFHPVSRDVLSNIQTAALTGRNANVAPRSSLDDTVSAALGTQVELLERQSVRRLMQPPQPTPSTSLTNTTGGI